jgi:hypothetical protein
MVFTRVIELPGTVVTVGKDWEFCNWNLEGVPEEFR